MFRQRGIKHPPDIIIKSDPVVGVGNEAYERVRVAPRSQEQYKIGPPFGETTIVNQIRLDSTRELVHPRLSARIDRGFDLFNDDTWVCYKRNYFSVVASFDFDELGARQSVFQEDTFSLADDDADGAADGAAHGANIKRFLIRLSSQYANEKTKVNLNQHTPKRDKGPVSEPPMVPVIPGRIPEHSVIKQTSNVKKSSKLQEFEHLFKCEYNRLLPTRPSSILLNYEKDKPYNTVAKYERLQFAYAPKRRVSNGAEPKLVLQVHLLAELADSSRLATVAAVTTVPFLVRGRSPSNYESTSKTDQISHKTHKIHKIHKSSPLKRVTNVSNLDNIVFRERPTPISGSVDFSGNKENNFYDNFSSSDDKPFENSNPYLKDLPNVSLASEPDLRAHYNIYDEIPPSSLDPHYYCTKSIESGEILGFAEEFQDQQQQHHHHRRQFARQSQTSPVKPDKHTSEFATDQSVTCVSPRQLHFDTHKMVNSTTLKRREREARE
ncbi:uncharacterized protein LODBEIA_P15770 [Lodderomyces beijingensis]|uniref:NDT80 domain-containing protein n=1 Tax=Lodderomyces beijingensis TaxID=1775926 RepID=A0ABP0ZIA1_9ASCO